MTFCSLPRPINRQEPVEMLGSFYHNIFEIINVPLGVSDYIFWIGLFISEYFALFFLFNTVSERYRNLPSFDKKIHIILQSVKFSNKIFVNFVTLGCVLFWDERLLFVANWNDYKDVFYNLSSLFVWSDVVALSINRSSMTTQCQLHHLGVVIAYLYVITTTHLGDGLFRACIMYGVFAATAFFHNLYSVLKNLLLFSEVSSTAISMSWQQLLCRRRTSS